MVTEDPEFDHNNKYTHVTFAAIPDSESTLSKEKADRNIAAQAFPSGDKKVELGFSTSSPALLGSVTMSRRASSLVEMVGTRCRIGRAI